MSEHLTVPVPLPPLDHLSLAELTSLRSFLNSRTKEYRRDANKALQKAGEVRNLWMTTLSLRATASEEERQAAFEPFHRELLRHPEAYLAYAQANSMHVMSEHVWAEMVRRSK